MSVPHAIQVAPKGFFTWDFWSLIDGKGLHHIFYLQAPRDNYNPEGRHNFASVGHSVSTDLKEWEYRGIAVPKGAPGSWNDMAIWTGSAVQTQVGDYAMLVTGRSTRDAGKVQRIGVYFSSDLYQWKEYEFNPILECNTEVFEKHHPVEKSTSWRDPCLFFDTEARQYKALITAQRRSKDDRVVGCLAVGRSANLIDWTVDEYLNTPEDFLLFECPQILFIKNEVFILFSADKRWIFPDASSDIIRATGTHLLKASSLSGAFQYRGSLYDGGIETTRGHLWGSYQLRAHSWNDSGEVLGFAWAGYDSEGAQVIGGLTPPTKFILK